MNIGLSTVDLEQIVDRHPDGMALHQGDTLLYVNQAMARTLGYADRTDMVGRSVLEFVHPDDRERAARRMRDALSDDGPLTPDQYRCLRRDDTEITLDVLPLRVAYGSSVAILLVLRDFSERQQGELQLLLNDRLAALGLVASGVVHELNNVITHTTLNVSQMIATLADAVAGDADRAPDAALARARDIRAGLQRMREVIASMQTFVRTRPADKVIHVWQVMESALVVASHLIGDTIAVQKEVRELPPVRGDEPQLMQVFLNLVVNAAQSMRDGGTLRLAAYLDADNRVVMQVGDTGPGIAPELRERIFAPLFTTKPPGEGTGLGLWICRKIVTDLHGVIEVESEVGQGSTFRVILPTADGAD